MKNGLEVKSIVFGKLKEISSEEFRDTTGLDWTWEGLVDGADAKLVLVNSSEEARKAYIYVVSRPDIPTAAQHSWGNEIEIKPGEEKEINYVVPMHGIAASDYRDYTGPLRYAMEVTVSDPVQGEVVLKRVKYYDVPAKVETDELEESKFDIHRAMQELEKTTVLHDLHIGGDPKEGVKSIKAKLLNFGEKTQYIGIDTRAERKGSGYQTQFFYEVRPKDEMSVEIGSFIAKCPPGMEYLRIRAVSIPEHVFSSQKARSWFLWRSYEDDYKSFIAKFDFYFKESE